MIYINYHNKIAICEICNEMIYEGQGNVTMMGFNGNHSVHVIHVQDDSELYRIWRSNLMKKSA